ncbi:MAG: TonB-dependent receptor [Bacteroidales bacterium]|nr:TonB-dependent receptor [Bacteroidales bacterium]MBR0037154.1 TonB-dependent receptor [Bacteroidales bacterium]
MLTNQSNAKWKRFSGASYASFQSLHREVRIGVLSVAMLASVALKANATGTSGSYAAAVGNPYVSDVSGEDSLVVGLEDVEVLASRVPLTQVQAPRLVTVLSAVDIAAAAVHSINDLLEYAVGIDVRQRGDMGVQTDISVRGGTFDQITLLLNGVNISSPHTGHLSADFPVTVQDIERIEVVEGPSARVFGTSAFTGVVNIVTRKGDSSAHLYGGSYGYAGADLRLSGKTGKIENSLSGGYSRSDGATPNSFFQSTRAFYQGEYKDEDLQVDLQLGYSYKPYGANTFYGAASTDQWESNERYMGALTAQTHAGRLHLSPAVSWNRWFDHYQWHKGSPLGENYHQVDTWSASLNSWFETRFGKTSFGFEMRNEGIYSTKLGEPMVAGKYFDVRGHDGLSDSTQYTHHANRTNLSAFIEHDLLLRDWTLSAGLLANMNTGLDYKWRVYPGVDVSWRPSAYWKLFLSWNMALRMPTFTDLYYSGANIEGTTDLKPEKTNDVSVGTRFRRDGWRVEASVFYSHKSDMIDWVVYSDDLAAEQALNPSATGTFCSGNFELDNVGVEWNATFLPREIWQQCYLKKIGVQYAYIDEDISYSRSIEKSKYAMEYLRHKVVLQAETRLWKQLNLSLSWRWQDRVGTGNDPYSLLDGRLSWDASKWTIYADCSNLLNATYYDYSYIKQPGRWGKIGFLYHF